MNETRHLTSSDLGPCNTIGALRSWRKSPLATHPSLQVFAEVAKAAPVRRQTETDPLAAHALVAQSVKAPVKQMLRSEGWGFESSARR